MVVYGLQHVMSMYAGVVAISAAAITAVLLNLLFNGMRRDAEAPIAAEGPTPGVTPDQDVPGGRERSAH